MDYIVVQGVKPYDGRYEFDLEGRELTTREWGWIKRLAGYNPLTIEEGQGDPELIVLFAAIAICRAGKVEPPQVPQLFERLSDVPFDGSAITMETDVETEAEDDAGPPAPSSTSNGDTSGPGSRKSSEMSPASPPVSGTRDSAISESLQIRSVT